MFGEDIQTARVVAKLPRLWLNPWAHKPITDSLPFDTHTARDTGELLADERSPPRGCDKSRGTS
jgi:hypothetical protein